MNSKIIGGIAVLVLIVIAAYLFSMSLTTGSTPTAGPTTVPEVITEPAEISSVVGEQYSVLIQEELDKMSIEQTDFNSQVEEQIASDLSQFYYE